MMQGELGHVACPFTGGMACCLELRTASIVPPTQALAAGGLRKPPSAASMCSLHPHG